MSHRALVNYLYSHSRWIEDYFTFAKEPNGPIPEIKVGESSRFFSRDEIKMFDAELSRIHRPHDAEVIADGFDNLRALVHTAAANPNFKLLLSVQ
jgi:hypothetical protein